MAFEIIELTEEEQKEFAKRGIENPNWEKRPGHPLAIPLDLTIDRERDIMLFGEGEIRDDWMHRYFVYIHKEKVITFLAEAIYDEYDDYRITYRIYQILNGIGMTEEDRENLREAFDQYQILGTNNEITVKVTLVFEV